MVCRGVSSRAELCTVLHHPPWRQQDKDESSTRVLVQTGAEARGQVRREGLGAVVLAHPGPCLSPTALWFCWARAFPDGSRLQKWQEILRTRRVCRGLEATDGGSTVGLAVPAG